MSKVSEPNKFLETPPAAPAATPDTAGFVTSLPSDMKRPPFGVQRYTLARCAEYGGVRGYGIERRQTRHYKGRSDSNPDGLFWEYLIKLTAPCPVVMGPDSEVLRAEPSTFVTVVLEDQVEEIEPYFEEREWCAEIAFVPVKKKNAWTITTAVAAKPVPRASIVAK